MATSLEAAMGEERAPGILPDHVSFSSVDLFLRCPESWRARYLSNQRGPASEPLAVGSSVHAGIAAYYDSLRTQARIAKSEREQIGIQAASDELDDIVDRALNDGPGLDFARAIPDVDEEVISLVTTYIKQRPNHIKKPVAIEEKFALKMPDSDIEVWGYIDLEAETATGTNTLVEIKTSGRMISKPTGSWKIQAWLYQNARPLPMEWHVLVKRATGNHELVAHAGLAVPYDELLARQALSLVSSTLERVQTLYAQRGPDEEWPLSGILHPWACSTCDARSSCVYGGAS
jgi:hypothetical protein